MTDQSSNPERTEEANFRSEFPSFDIAYNITSELVGNQSDEIKTLSDTANTILATTTTLLGTALIIQAVLLSRYPKNFFNRSSTSSNSRHITIARLALILDCINH